MDPTTNDPDQPVSTNTPAVPPAAPATPGEPVTPAAPTNPVATGPEPAATGPVVGGSDNVTPVAPVGGSGRLKKILIIAAIVLVLGVGSAAAYLGIILPNKPINILKQSLANTLQEPQSSFKGSFESDASGDMAYKADFSGATDAAAKAADFKLNLTASGVSFPVEARLVKQNVYIKVGDLTTVAGLASAYSPEIGSLATSLNQQIANKWIVIDSTLLNQLGVGCYLDSGWGMSEADIQLLNKVYDKNAFVTIKSTASDMVNGQKAEKFVLSIDNDKLAAYGNDKALDNLSLVKSTSKCNKDATKSLTDTKGDHKQTSLTVWVDKGKKRIVKIASESKQGKSTATIEYKAVSIKAPDNAIPALQLLTQLQQTLSSSPAAAGLFGGSATEQ